MLVAHILLPLGHEAPQGGLHLVGPVQHTADGGAVLGVDG
ncbi:hypothetical protein SDC9_203238 [bioreactor metagenome]|uniref:Uncharacterized protein n=1 Tax=bioreactor metagenome TaxID=1076179 RepID=A0A645J500_9ZZZZ